MAERSEERVRAAVSAPERREAERTVPGQSAPEGGSPEQYVPGRDAAGMIVEGVVEHGRRLGRELCFPTANLPVPEHFGASDGVYRTRATVGGRTFDAMSNLGSNPSVGGVERRLETHIFGFGGELYGLRLRVELLGKIRDERRFASVGELRVQIARDRETVLAQIAGERE